MAFFGGQPKTPPVVEPQNSSDRREGNDIPEIPEPRGNTGIAKDVIVTGKLSGEGVVQIEGSVVGEVSLKGYGIVTPTGNFKGPVEADVIRIAGSVEGKVTAHDHLRLEKTGTVEGDVTTVSFVIEDGGRLNGRTTMIKGQTTVAESMESVFDSFEEAE